MGFQPEALASFALIRDSAGVTVSNASTTSPGTAIPGLVSRTQIDWSGVDDTPRLCRLYAVAKGSTTLGSFNLFVRDVTAGATVAQATFAAGTTVAEAVGSWATFTRPPSGTTNRTYEVYVLAVTVSLSPVVYVAEMQFR